MIVAPLGGIMADKVFKIDLNLVHSSVFNFSGDVCDSALLHRKFKPYARINLFGTAVACSLCSLLGNLFNSERAACFPDCSGYSYRYQRKLSMPVDGVYPAMFGSWIDKFGNQGFTYIFMFLIGNCVFGILIALWAKRLDKQCKNGRTMNLGKLAASETTEAPVA